MTLAVATIAAQPGGSMILGHLARLSAPAVCFFAVWQMSPAQANDFIYDGSQSAYEFDLQSQVMQTVNETKQVEDTCYKDGQVGTHQECEDVPHQVCGDYPEQECTTTTKHECHEENSPVCTSHQVCAIEPQQECHNVSHQECSPVSTQQCTTSYQQECHNESYQQCYNENVCSPVSRQVCEVVGGRQQCHTETSQSCHTETRCTPESRQVCENVPHQDCREVTSQECHDVSNQVCSTVNENVCHDQQDCKTEEHNVCTDTPEQSCQTVTKHECKDEPEHECKTVPTMGQVPYACTKTIEVPVQEVAYDVDARVAVNFAPLPKNSKADDSMSLGLSGEDLDLVCTKSADDLILFASREQTEQNVSAAQKTISATYSVKPVLAEDVTTPFSIALERFQMNKKPLSFVSGKIADAEYIQVGLKIQQQAADGTSVTLFDGSVPSGALRMSDAGSDQSKVEVSFAKIQSLGVLKSGDYDISIDLHLEPTAAAQILNRDKLPATMEQKLDKTVEIR